MRVFFDYDAEEDIEFLEIQLTEEEIKMLLSYKPIEKESFRDILLQESDVRTVNVYVRRCDHAAKTRVKSEDNQCEYQD